MNRRLIGILLIVGVIIIGAAIQQFGPGLIIVKHYTPTSPTGGLVKETRIRATLAPLVLLGICGAVLAIRRKQTKEQPKTKGPE